LAFIEASWVTGPAKNLIQFANHAAQGAKGSRPAHIAIATFQRSGTRNQFIHACRQAGVELHIIPERFAFDPRIIPAVRHLIASVKPDIVQTHNVKSHFLMRLTASHKRVKWIAFQHGYTWPDFKMRLYNLLDRISLPEAHHVVTVCLPFASALQKIGVNPQRITVRHNAVEPAKVVSPQRLSELRRSLGAPHNAIVILTVGRLSREKGHIDLLKAVGLLKRGFAPEFRVVIVGDGPERRPLEVAAQKLGISRHVIFAGQQADVAPYYAMADLVVLPSHSEGSPNVLLEAIAAGIPVVATEVGGIPEIANNVGNTLLVNKGDVSELANTVSAVARDKRLRQYLARKANACARKYCTETYCDSLVQLYLHVLAQQPGDGSEALCR
jgi:glycosyltransferase involved in cell wall biosynthesis